MKLARKTNHLERFNNTLRQRVSRLVRTTLAFSKKLANHIRAIRYFICYYSLTRAAAFHGSHYAPECSLAVEDNEPQLKSFADIGISVLQLEKA
jgi:IS1 transposase